ncbi:hypothetical protein RvY_07603 [Ramazzottius varieornatus]|uniref:EIF-4F 25 kDa subunit n=1 Tax=Ramazzottius varieornatus TaxID=947166 RepID=A0A1D1VB61_RAMVA|nr:hypothetical protein RvY_07603 [Ramazzottius varieornatus]
MGRKGTRRQNRRGSGQNQQKEVIQVTESPVMLPEEQGSAEKASKSPLNATQDESQQQEVLRHPPALPAQLTEPEKTQTSEMIADILVSSQSSSRSTEQTVVAKAAHSGLVPANTVLNPRPGPFQQIPVVPSDSSRSEGDQNTPQGPHPLETFWTCYYTDPDVPKHMWKLAVKEVHTFRSVEEFWSVFNHLTPPTNLKMRSDLSWFRWVDENQVRPEWENPRNKQGGCWKVVFLQNPKDINFDAAYKEVLMLLIGEQFGNCSEIVNGMVAQTRGMDDVRLQVWTSTTDETSNRPIARRIIKALRDQKIEVMMEFHDFGKPQRLLHKER